MNQTNFWLISIDEGIVSASLILLKESSFSIAAIGGQVEWHQEDDTSLLTAVDGSLSQAALKAGLSEDQEPENAAFILPPFWVGSDGKIVADKKRISKIYVKHSILNRWVLLPMMKLLLKKPILGMVFPSALFYLT